MAGKRQRPAISKITPRASAATTKFFLVPVVLVRCQSK